MFLSLWPGHPWDKSWKVDRRVSRKTLNIFGWHLLTRFITIFRERSFKKNGQSQSELKCWIYSECVQANKFEKIHSDLQQKLNVKNVNIKHPVMKLFVVTLRPFIIRTWKYVIFVTTLIAILPKWKSIKSRHIRILNKNVTNAIWKPSTLRLCVTRQSKTFWNQDILLRMGLFASCFQQSKISP